MRYYYEKVLNLMQTRGYEGVTFRGRPPSPPAHLLHPGFPRGVPLTFSSTAGAVWSGGPGALFPPVLLPIGVGRWGGLQLGAGAEHLSGATGW